MLASLSSNPLVLGTEPVIGFLKKLDILISLNLVLNVLKSRGGCMQTFCKGGANLGYLKKVGVCTASSIRESTGRQC